MKANSIYGMQSKKQKFSAHQPNQSENFMNILLTNSMGGIFMVMVWLLVDAPIFIFFLIQSFMCLYFLKKPELGTGIKVVNGIFLFLGMGFLAILFYIHIWLFMKWFSEFQYMRDAANLTNVMAFFILLLGIFSNYKGILVWKKGK